MAGHSSVQFVGFSIISDEEALRESHGAVTSYELYSASGQPVAGGVYDLRFGSNDHSYVCLTCNRGKKHCPGHRGHLAMRVAVTQPIAVAEIRRWLRVACLRCGEIVVDREKYAGAPAAKRLVEAAAAATEGRRCPKCQAVHPRIVKDDEDNFTFWADPEAAPPGGGRGGRSKAAQRLYPDTLRAIFERVADGAVEALGRPPESHPRHLVRRVIGVPPNTIRPGIRSFGGVGGSSYHDVTNLLQHLVRRNELLPEQLPDAMGVLGPGGGPVDGDVERAVQNLLQINYDMIIGSSSTSVTQGSSGKRGLVVGARPVHSILRGLARKDGRIRGNLLGGRVFFISRSTISGNMAYATDEVGVPLEYARILQVEETVQEFNRDWLMPFFLNGRRRYPGCTLLTRRATREVHDVAGLRDVRLEVGDTLLRDVVSGDVAFFNRQPTLERSSITAMRVIVVQDPSVHTFQINVTACPWFNAD